MHHQQPLSHISDRVYAVDEHPAFIENIDDDSGAANQDVEILMDTSA
jgi:hypothetical protein